jgi:hypothetical protein
MAGSESLFWVLSGQGFVDFYLSGQGVCRFSLLVFERARFLQIFVVSF